MLAQREISATQSAGHLRKNSSLSPNASAQTPQRAESCEVGRRPNGIFSFANVANHFEKTATLPRTNQRDRLE
jgi:hypothetical protein